MKLLSTIFRLLTVSLSVVIITTPTIVLAEYGGGNVKGYASDKPIDYGTIVELTGDKSDRIKVSSQSEMQNMFGVVIDPQHLTVRVTNGNIENETYVAVSGTYNVLVSTQAGSIAKGDFITMSAINGIGMKAGTEEPTVFGRAAAAFDGKGVNLGKASLQNTEGKQTGEVILGSIPVTVDIRSNPNEKSTKVNVPDILERIGQAIAEKEVSPIRIYLSMAITAVSLVAAIAVLYAGIRNGVISIGRNPMSRRSIFRALLEVILTSLLILIIGLFAVYLLLRL